MSRYSLIFQLKTSLRFHLKEGSKARIGEQRPNERNGASKGGLPPGCWWLAAQAQAASRPMLGGYPRLGSSKFWVFKPLTPHLCIQATKFENWEFLSLEIHSIFSKHSYTHSHSKFHFQFKLCAWNSIKNKSFNNNKKHQSSICKIKFIIFLIKPIFLTYKLNHHQWLLAMIPTSSIHTMWSRMHTRHQSMMHPKTRCCLNPRSIFHSSIPNKRLVLPNLTCLSWNLDFYWIKCIPMIFFWLFLSLLSQVHWFGKDWMCKKLVSQCLRKDAHQVFDKMPKRQKHVQFL